MAPHKSRGSDHIKCAFRFPIPWLDAVVEKMFQRERVAPIPMEETNSSSLENAYEFGCRIVCGIFSSQVLDFVLLSFLVPFALYLQQFGTRTCHCAWYLLHFGMVVTLHFA